MNTRHTPGGRFAARDGAERFWEKVRKADGCWLWAGTRSRKGYGYIWWDSGMRPASRVAWILTHGPIASRYIFVCHHCDNPPCVNPSHLFLGTNRDNLLDAMRKGRWAPPRPLRGEDAPGAKVRARDVAAIRRRYARGERQDALAAAYGINRTTLRHIIHGDTWRHVGGAMSGSFNMRRARGEQVKNARLTVAAVRRIRRKYAEGTISYRRLAAAEGVDTSTIADIVTRYTWKHVD